MRIAVLDTSEAMPPIDKRPWFVEQERTTSHGYRIVPFDPEGAHVDREPSLAAFHIDLGRYGPRIRIALINNQGATIGGSTRDIRMLDESASPDALVLLALLPLAFGSAVAFARRKITSAWPRPRPADRPPL